MEQLIHVIYVSWHFCGERVNPAFCLRERRLVAEGQMIANDKCTGISALFKRTELMMDRSVHEMR